ncbi:MAG TPA: ABC transporter substrate-binding protein [Burkholderiales bacterium]|nr:ABC transporter substrate-binding protein [Burkholderiales bacterium]
MNNEDRWSRREFLGTALSGAAAVLGVRPGFAVAEPPPETTRLRLIRLPAVCVAPEYVAGELLKTEGFTDVQYVKVESTAAKVKALIAGQADITLFFAAPTVVHVDAGDPVFVLAGVHIGCLEVFATERIRSVRDLKGRTVAIPAMGSTEQVFLSSMLAYVGVDPARDVRWVFHAPSTAMQLLADGTIDGLLALPPASQELRARRIGHVIVNSAVDRPWSQYFCCMAIGNRGFVQKHPVATKRALRAILKAADICALQPEVAARSIVDKGFTPRYDYALQALKDIPYGKWRECDPVDTMRFYALRLHDAGIIKSSPAKIIAQGGDWRFWKELRKELKA